MIKERKKFIIDTELWKNELEKVYIFDTIYDRTHLGEGIDIMTETLKLVKYVKYNKQRTKIEQGIQGYYKQEYNIEEQYSKYDTKNGNRDLYEMLVEPDFKRRREILRIINLPRKVYVDNIDAYWLLNKRIEDLKIFRMLRGKNEKDS